MKKLIIIAIFISFFNCNENPRKTILPIEKFERILENKETIYLNEIVKDLDNYLSTLYPNKKSKFKLYLVDITKNNIKEYWNIDTNKLKKYKRSKLSRKYDTIFPDSVWYNNKSFKIKYPDSNLVDEISFFRGKNENNIDSIINSLKVEPRLLVKEESNFYLALNTIKQSDSLITISIKSKTMGNIAPPALAYGILNHLSDNNEYIAKRIFIMNMYDYK